VIVRGGYSPRLATSKSPRSMPAPHADVIKEQQVIGCIVPTSREKYHARVLVLAFSEGGWLCRQLRPVDFL
jgi:hypothetical protein